MTEIAVRPEQTAVATYGTDSMDRLSRWVEQARAVSTIAADICATSFAPAAYRGKPAEATAAILAGAELGFDPMASLRAFDNIQGVPAPKAITLRAVVQGAGHQVRIVRSSEQEAVVAGRRRGEENWQESVWTIDRAKKLGLLSKDQWMKQPAAMLVARATAEVCRWVASDAIMGMPYAAEEIGDQPEHVAAPATRRLTVAELDDAPAAIEQADAEPGMVTDHQRKTMFALWGELGYGTEADRKTRLDLTARFIGVKEIESSNDLTQAEADVVIAKLRERKAQQHAQAGGPA